MWQKILLFGAQPSLKGEVRVEAHSQLTPREEDTQQGDGQPKDPLEAIGQFRPDPLQNFYHCNGNAARSTQVLLLHLVVRLATLARVFSVRRQGPMM